MTHLCPPRMALRWVGSGPALTSWGGQWEQACVKRTWLTRVRDTQPSNLEEAFVKGNLLSEVGRSFQPEISGATRLVSERRLRINYRMNVRPLIPSSERSLSRNFPKLLRLQAPCQIWGFQR